MTLMTLMKTHRAIMEQVPGDVLAQVGLSLGQASPVSLVPVRSKKEDVGIAANYYWRDFQGTNSIKELLVLLFVASCLLTASGRGQRILLAKEKAFLSSFA